MRQNYCGLPFTDEQVVDVALDDKIIRSLKDGLDCNTILTCTSIFLYADDIMLISPSVSVLQTMLHLCESELLDLDMSLNVKSRSACALVPVSMLLAPN